ncbi:MAG: hypothetical protein ACRDN9_04300 [Streptosporangiaceae bacterium]
MTSRRSLAGSAILVAFLATACGAGGASEGPTVDKAGKTLTHDAHKLMQGAQKSSVFEVTDFTVTKNGKKNVSCGEGKAKREFAAKAGLTPEGADLDGGLDATTEATSPILDHLNYDVTSKGADIPDDRVLSGTKDSKGVKLTVIVAGDGSSYKVKGSTRCLPTG